MFGTQMTYVLLMAFAGGVGERSMVVAQVPMENLQVCETARRAAYASQGLAHAYMLACLPVTAAAAEGIAPLETPPAIYGKGLPLLDEDGFYIPPDLEK